MQWNQLDSVKFRLKGAHDWSWLRRHGAAFWAIDETGSGCLGLGMERDGKKYFCKIAGVDTIEAEVSPAESVRQLKAAVPLYAALRHPNLVRLTESYDCGPFFVAVFEWAEGECLFDHWNFEQYQKIPTCKAPRPGFSSFPSAKSCGRRRRCSPFCSIRRSKAMWPWIFMTEAFYMILTQIKS